MHINTQTKIKGYYWFKKNILYNNISQNKTKLQISIKNNTTQHAITQNNTKQYRITQKHNTT